MNFDQFLLLGAILVPALGALSLLCGMGRSDDFAKKLSCFAFGFPCLAGIALFLRFDDSIHGYNFTVLYSRTVSYTHLTLPTICSV